MGAFVGCFIVLLIMVLMSLQRGPQNISFEGTTIEWIIIACIFAAVSWCGFYIYYYLVARDLNKKLSK